MFLPIACGGHGELDRAQLRGAGGQRVEADLDARGERAAEELPVGADGVDVGGGAEVDDHDRPAAAVGTAAVELVRGQRGDDAVGADLARVVDVQRDAGAHARAR